MIFDKNIYQSSWDEIIKNEIFRQRDKSSSNDIGYFHQNIFQYFKNCTVPKEGWDVIYKNPDGIPIIEGSSVHTVYVEMKNKHNTMNSASSAKTYIKMQNQVLKDDDSACFLVEAIAKRSQNIKWSTSVDKQKVQHKLIRRVSMDQFYALVTGEEDAFYQLCLQLPTIIEHILAKSDESLAPKDTVFDELNDIAKKDEIPIALAMYMLGFSDYIGFKK